MKRKSAKSTTSRVASIKADADVPVRAIQNLVGVFKLLGDETRLRILYHLYDHSELHVTNLCTLLGQSQPAVSHHLALLRVAGVIEVRREGKHNFYSVSPVFFSNLVRNTLGAVGAVPRRLAFHEFVLQYTGNSNGVAR